ncbi:uncharacterized protein ASPGLDRAFT_78761 [Aspergillus glaucus CBS 516.65]|uniref:Uncharacterized protein n=1 Tax=Aspergillus glaucus CBS 516.65 TaxID=1160497 RepID=A0A1L9W0N6_ASPGL|nr:hypothetical protein ASPGLDRAFT_78761 [Aspergillus glaucus CBS 516.65]OJJ89647.1 hypothetical protein ASPGLDRAFT_78761 [Aspergillus glaucus CBS 516.65]
MSQDQKPSSYSYSESHFPTATVLYSHITEQVRGHGNNPNPVHDNNFIVTYSDVGPFWGKDADFALERQKCFELSVIKYSPSQNHHTKSSKKSPASPSRIPSVYYRASFSNVGGPRVIQTPQTGLMCGNGEVRVGVLVMWSLDSEATMQVRGTVEVWTLEGSMDGKPRVSQVETIFPMSKVAEPASQTLRLTRGKLFQY